MATQAESSPRAERLELFRRCSSFQQTVQLEVCDATFTVKSSDGEKKILQSVSFSVDGGDFLAMMGPSGAGKTTLLEMMTLSLKTGTVEGQVTLNGKPFSKQYFQDHAAYVEQYDHHWAFLTCQEVLTYAAALYMVDDAEVQRKHVQELMDHLGLRDCADTRCGNDLFKGLSGGQKKRLSLGVAMLKSPSVLFLDEPTSGLDAASAASVMGYVSQLARDAGMIVIATIHQPATDLFLNFTSVLFLTGGRVAYFGTPTDVDCYCRTIGQPLPEDTNPADHFMQLINSEFSSHDAVDAIVKNWASTPSCSSESFKALEDVCRPSQWSACSTLLRRHLKLSVRDPTLYIGRALMFLVTNVFFALVYLKTRTLTQNHVVPFYFLGGWMVAVPTLFSLVAVYNANEEFKIIRKEHKNGMVPVASYLLTVFVLQLPYMMLLSCAALLVPFYGVAGASPVNAVSTLAVVTCALWSFEQVSVSFAAGFDNALVGMLGAIGLWFANFLFCGTFLKPEFLLWPLQKVSVVFPLRWTFSSMSFLGFHGTVWEGAQDLGDNKFVCLTGGACFGRTGDQVLASLSHTFAVTQENTVARDLFFIFAYGLVFKLLHVLLTVKKTQIVQRNATPTSRFCAETTHGDIEDSSVSSVV